jgi:hypothetical protein
MLSLLCRLSRRRAVATIIGGLIILTLILTALGTMVFVSQQYDQYQQTANKMAQYEDQGQSENIVANYPGLTIVSSISCGGCVVYNMSLSNLGGVGVQIARIYITSTVSPGCTTLCILNPSSSTPTSTSSAFQQSEQFLNAGEVNHAVLLYLPSTIGSLPSSAASQNTIQIVTSRGNVFSFQWPIQIQMGGQSQSAFSAGIVKIAYQQEATSPAPPAGVCDTQWGCDSMNEPGPVAGGSGGKTPGNGTQCHSEPPQSYPPGASYAEEVKGVTAWSQTLGKVAPVGDSGDLWFVNPWVTNLILVSAANGVCTSAGACSTTPTTGTWSNHTTLYLSVNITNTGTNNYTVAGGSLDLTWYGSNHIDGNLIGIYYNASKATGPTFYSISTTQPQEVQTGTSFQAIFRLTLVTLNCSGSACTTGTSGSGDSWPPLIGVTFWGSASLTDSTEDASFVGGVSLSSGLWIAPSC